MGGDLEPAGNIWDYVPEAEKPLYRLIDALDRADLAAVQVVIGDYPDLLGRTVYNGDAELIPLEYAAYDGHDEIVRWLLARGADPNLMSDAGRTALWSAAWQVRQMWALRGHLRRATAEWDEWARRFRVIRLLLDAGADLHAPCDTFTPDGVMRAFSQVGLLEALDEYDRLRAAG